MPELLEAAACCLNSAWHEHGRSSIPRMPFGHVVDHQGMALLQEIKLRQGTLVARL